MGVSADDSNPAGTTTVYLSRRWTGNEQFTLKVKSDTRGAEITEITWNRGNSEYPVEEDEAKEQTTSLCRNLMECEWSTRSQRTVLGRPSEIPMDHAAPMT